MHQIAGYCKAQSHLTMATLRKFRKFIANTKQETLQAKHLEKEPFWNSLSWKKIPPWDEKQHTLLSK